MSSRKRIFWCHLREGGREGGRDEEVGGWVDVGEIGIYGARSDGLGELDTMVR
jgi:hypothetical protein